MTDCPVGWEALPSSARIPRPANGLPAGVPRRHYQSSAALTGFHYLSSARVGRVTAKATVTTISKNSPIRLTPIT